MKNGTASAPSYQGVSAHIRGHGLGVAPWDATSSLPAFVASPLTGKSSPLIKTVSTAFLIREYWSRFKYSADECFKGLQEIGLYECPDTGYRFYHPFSVAGPESLYRQLEKFEWNYKEGKWEHDTCLGLVEPGTRVLDVGCGRGSFLSRCLAKGAKPTGIELNKSAAEYARSRGVEVREEMLGAHVGEYDVVTSFQVLEHVTDPLAFLTDSVRVLKSGGRLIIGVPNEDGFVGQDDDAVLNMPPHHVGRWNERSLAALTTLLPLSLEWVRTEPLAEPDWYQATMEHKYITGWRAKLYHRLGWGKVFAEFIREQAHTIAGHSVLAVYRKR